MLDYSIRPLPLMIDNPTGESVCPWLTWSSSLLSLYGYYRYSA